jgi:glycosyltransferase involved in cell wall biosynthesis
VSDYIHIVALDAPSPPDYGGAIDIFYKILALSAAGKKVTLHYFDYKEGRGVEGLEKLCYKIHCYKRKTGLKGFSFHTPYLVHSRINNELIKTLNRDQYPVILEGIHCSGILPYLKKSERKIVLRLHNNEEKYYKALAKSARSTFKQLYYFWESRLLRRYQNTLPKNLCIAGLSEGDLQDFHALHYTNLHFLPSFIPWQNIHFNIGTGDYCLYQGNMTVSENEEAALWLVDNIFSKSQVPFIIAGKKPSYELHKKIKSFRNIQVIADPSEEEMQRLVSNAQINILPSFNNTGIKLKLLNALFNGRFCITNKAGMDGSYSSSMILADNKKEMAEQVNHFFTKPFSKAEAKERESLLKIYNNRTNAEKLIALIS